MASGYPAQYVAAQEGGFYNRVTIAIMLEAYTVYTEATTLSGNLPQGAITSIPITPALTVAVPAATEIMVGNNDVFITSGISAINATSLAVTSASTSKTWPIGTIVSPPTPAGHTVRAGLATQILTAIGTQASFAQRFCFACAAQGLDNETSTDAQILAGAHRSGTDR
jgi:hypothetical protein